MPGIGGVDIMGGASPGEPGTFIACWGNVALTIGIGEGGTTGFFREANLLTSFFS